jgi:hypothetical protein
METQAYIRIRPNGMGEFQFGLVSGQIDGELADCGGKERLEFTWDGIAELDPISGSGCLQLIDGDTLAGRIKIHMGDRSKLSARRVE